MQDQGTPVTKADIAAAQAGALQAKVTSAVISNAKKAARVNATSSTPASGGADDHDWTKQGRDDSGKWKY